MPVLFVGHGSPMNAIEDTPYSRGWKAAAAGLPSPSAVVCISAHWLTPGTFVTAMDRPRTIHDFYGFPQELFDVDYPAPGSPQTAETISQTQPAIRLDEEWGLDHGTWSVLVHMFPEANVPVVQVSLDRNLDTRRQYEVIRTLRPLRDNGVLFVGSGNIVHNLRALRFFEGAEPYDWAVEFDAQVTALLEQGDHGALIDYRDLGPAAHMSVPTDEHYRPMLAALALSYPDEQPRFFNEGIDIGSIGMRSFVLG
jgi:4,5-DOPA dioxygenase extradiol